jgi:endonuclease G
VALHHASVPAPEHPELGRVVNEGIRVSRLLRFIDSQALTADQRALVAELLGSEKPPVPTILAGGSGTEAASPTLAASARVDGARGLTSVTVPLQLTVRLGDRPAGATVTGAGDAEAITIAPNFADRQGYDPNFLRAEVGAVPLPALAAELVPLAAINSLATGEPRYVLPYHHFSVVLNKDRRLAFYTAVNIDGASGVRLRREPDRWSFDPRVPQDQQTGEQVYRDNPLDRGHLVRRLDPTWGPSAAAAKLANDDTFHFTNCTPQHHEFNAGQTLWAGLEDYILDNADNRNFRVSVFTGPVLAADDDRYRGVQLPRQFWKVVAMVKQDGALSATAYLLSQEQLIQGLEVAPETFSYGAYRTYQVPVRHIEGLTGLSFRSLADADPLGRQEATIIAREVRRSQELLL